MEIRYRVRDVRKIGKKIADNFTRDNEESNSHSLPRRKPIIPNGKTLIGIISGNTSGAIGLDEKNQYQEFLETVAIGPWTGCVVRGELYIIPKNKIKPYKIYR